MLRRLLVLVLVLPLMAAAQPGGIPRNTLAAGDVTVLEGAGFPLGCAGLFDSRASEEPGSARGRAAAQAREALIELGLSRDPARTRAGVLNDIARRTRAYRQELLTGKTDPAEVNSNFNLCDQEYRFGLVKLWAIPTNVEPTGGSEYFQTRDFANVCAGAYRYVAGFSDPSLARAAARSEGAVTEEFQRRSRLPPTEAVGAVVRRAQGFKAAIDDGRLSYDKLQATVQVCDQYLGQSVDSWARMTPAACERAALDGIERRATHLSGVDVNSPASLGRSLEARCSISKYTLGLLKEGKCTGDPLDLVQTALNEDLGQMSRLKAATGRTLECTGD